MTHKEATEYLGKYGRYHEGNLSVSKYTVRYPVMGRLLFAGDTQELAIKLAKFATRYDRKRKHKERKKLEPRKSGAEAPAEN